MVRTRKKKEEIPKSLVSLQKSIETYNTFLNVPLVNGISSFQHINLGTNLKTKKLFCNTIVHDPENKHVKFNIDKPHITKYSYYKTIRHKLNPTDEQKIELHKMSDAYIDIYNVCVNHLKELRKNYIETNNLTEVQISKLMYCNMGITFNITQLQQLFNTERYEIQKKYIGINLRILKYAIRDFIAMFDSIVTNQLKGHIKGSKMRILKKTKKTKIFKIEQQLCNDTSFCKSIIGDVLNIIPKLNYNKNYDTVHIIQYEQKTDSFYLLRRKKKIPTDAPKLHSVVAIDPGVRTLATGISDSHVLEMGIGFGKDIENSLKRIDEIKTFSTIKRDKYPLISETKANKLILKIENKIKNKVKDIHWKCANYLTNNYKNILIGNMSTRGMKKTNGTPKYLLEVTKKLNMYNFRERIKYKCLMKGCNYKKVNEAYTTQCCVKCGTVNKIGSNKIYECGKCHRTYDRDVKSAGCIYLKALKIKDELQ